MTQELRVDAITEERMPSTEALFNSAQQSLGLQSYEYFEGNGDWRNAQKAAFLSGEIVNPNFDYPLLNPAVLDEHKTALIGLLEDINNTADDPDEDMANWSAVGYRLAEVYFLKEATRLNDDSDIANRELSADRFVELDSELYGRAEKPIFDAAVDEIWRQIDAKQLDEAGLAIKQELAAMLPRPEGAGNIPMISQEAIDFYGQKIEQYFYGEKMIVDRHWQRLVSEGREADGFTPDDVLAVFQDVNSLRDGDQYGVRVEKYDGTAIAFSIADTTLKIGDKHTNVKNATHMFARVVHEYGIHVGRFINGLKSGVYVSATGHYDYLDFEEGSATVFDQIIKRKNEKLSPQNIGHYVHIGLAQGAGDGVERDFRQVFEIAWRYRLLMNKKAGEDINQAKIDETKSKTYDFTLKRIFRGTPSNMPGVVFTKDLTYLRGRVKATEYLEQHVGDAYAFYRLFAGKYDPTNELHSKVVNRIKR